ncbi:MAG: VOC family protein [Armatimonadota bacterium]|nr:VOC family protein [Armatimonadota bacterium]MDR7562889.1 VOC family protein [Armatimonadota bacterium]MDR7568494.1 VOC family protein [Armatimonadota bacterium]MDR7602128.1 VOC family protein [Armatimonadota bacterium]
MLQVDHLGVVVRNMEEALRFFVDVLGGKVISHQRNVMGREIDLAFVEACGITFELLYPWGETHPLRSYLQQVGPSVHHIALRSENVDGTVQQLGTWNVRPEGPPAVVGGTRVVQWLAAETTLGLRIQLTGPAPSQTPDTR